MIEVTKVQKHCPALAPFHFAKVFRRQIGSNGFSSKFFTFAFLSSLEVQAEVSDCKSFDIESITISEKSSKTMDSLKALAGSIKFVSFLFFN